MTGTAAYPASRLKRHPSTNGEVEDRRRALLEIVGKMWPATVRQVFYQATVRGIVTKTEAGYALVGRDLVLLRRAGELPYDHLADNTRQERRPATWRTPAEALRDVTRFYRKSLWDNAVAHVQIWLEKDALAGVVEPSTAECDVPLMVARGYASLSFLHSAAEQIAELDSPTHIYHLGDFDPSGVNAGEKIEQTLRELAPDAEISFERIAVNPEQIVAWNLPARPTKASDSRAAQFGHAESVELDAIEPNRLRDIVRDAIERHMPPAELATLQAAEESEHRGLMALVARLQGDTL